MLYLSTYTCTFWLALFYQKILHKLISHFTKKKFFFSLCHRRAIQYCLHIAVNNTSDTDKVWEVVDRWSTINWFHQLTCWFCQVANNLPYTVYLSHLPTGASVQKMEGVLEMEADCNVKEVYLCKVLIYNCIILHNYLQWSLYFKTTLSARKKHDLTLKIEGYVQCMWKIHDWCHW